MTQTGANIFVAEVVELMSTMVAPDKGEVSLKSFDEPNGVLELLYRKGVNEACQSCEITDELLATFTEEALRTRGVNISRVLVSATGS